jgi:hypothetical protein
MALVLGGCSGPAVTSNSPPTSTPSTTPTTPTTPSTPLSLQGTPPGSVTAGTPYSFQPTVTPSTAVVTFAIAQKPTWANFNTSTGALSGTPSDSNQGTTSNITITASEGSASASIGPFAILVNVPAASTTGSATLTWVAPTENTDGTAVTDLAGYRIYYGTSATDLTQEIDLAGTTSTSYVVSGLAPGTYYFAVTAYSTAGMESAESNQASKSI